MFLTSALFSQPGQRHGFFTRRGGVSTGIYDSLNCALASDDSSENTLENRRRVAHAMGQTAEHLVSGYQVHSSIVATVDRPVPAADRPRADALVSATPGMILGILTADCAPVLFHDPVAGIIGAAHSGSKGTLHNISRNTVEAMEALGAKRSRINACIGPCIAQESYEVGPEFPLPFVEQSKELQRFFIPSPKAGHWQFDLRGMILSQLEELGLQAQAMPQDTCRDEADFFSNRRRNHRGEPAFGLQISTITLTP